MSRPVYLDHAATTPVAPEVRAAMLPFLGEVFGNPSSAHATGRAARVAVDEARERVAQALGCAANEVVFTSGGSEADNLAIRGALDRHAGRGRHLVVTAVEHDAVLKTAEELADLGRCEVSVVPCDGRGAVDPEAVGAAVRDDTVLVSMMLANNEVGTVQDVAAAAEAARRRNPGVLVHTDAVQALGRLPVDVRALGVDMASITAHKIYGPKGAGALYLRRGVAIAAQVSGGGQERARRSGTENVAAIAGLAAAVSLVEEERAREMPRLGRLAERLMETVLDGVPDAVLTGHGAPRLPSFATFAFAGLETEMLLTLLDRAGVEASGGSACSSGAHMPSHVLLAMGLPPRVAGGALRCTLGRGTTEDEVDRAAAAIVASVAQLRASLPAPA
ncbi:MAG TPA: cysteine desulfurase family protein [Candidatus Dormibacteraeota bacterium]|nr:cysteine desulfurase family protein [Candidatus Dormibacteraeota bacterium]